MVRCHDHVEGLMRGGQQIGQARPFQIAGQKNGAPVDPNAQHDAVDIIVARKPLCGWRKDVNRHSFVQIDDVTLGQELYRNAVFPNFIEQHADGWSDARKHPR